MAFKKYDDDATTAIIINETNASPRAFSPKHSMELKQNLKPLPFRLGLKLSYYV